MANHLGWRARFEWFEVQFLVSWSPGWWQWFVVFVWVFVEVVSRRHVEAESTTLRQLPMSFVIALHITHHTTSLSDTQSLYNEVHYRLDLTVFDSTCTVTGQLYKQQ